MEVECDNCYAIRSVPRSHGRRSPFVCYNCGTDLPTPFYRTARHKSAYSRRPIYEDDTSDYQLPLRPLRTRDFFPPPTHRMDTSMYARLTGMRDSLYSTDSGFYTPRISRRHEEPTYTRDSTFDIRRKATKTHPDSFTYRPRLSVDKLPPASAYSRDPIYTKPKLTREPSLVKPRFCPYQTLCREYVWSLSWPREYFNSRFDRCYCSQCYPDSYNDVYTIAGETYVIPRGWVRFGLYVDKIKADYENLWDTWIVTYHGTKIPAAQSILTHRQFLLPGDTCDDGTVIGIRKGHILGKNQVYTSPTIKYSSLNCYCDRYKYQTMNGKQYIAKIVLQCRQQPGTYKIQGETVGSGSKRICDIIPNNRVEIFTKVRPSVVPYGLLIQMTPV